MAGLATIALSMRAVRESRGVRHRCLRDAWNGIACSVLGTGADARSEYVSGRAACAGREHARSCPLVLARSLLMLIRLSRQLFVLILLCLPALASAQATPSLLQVSDAFKLSARMAAPGTLQLHWTIAPHYYLYRARISAKPLDAGVQLGALRLPNGLKEHDPYLGDVEIYHNALDAALPYTIRGAMAGNPSSGPSANLRVAVTFQGCHEVDPKICYPPATQTLEVPLTGVGAGAISLPVPQTGSRDSLTASFRQPGSARIDPPGSPTDGARVRATRAPDQSAEQQLAGLLGAHGFAAIMVFFVAGLGLALTP